MKIYKLEINSIKDDSPMAVGSYRAPRTTMKTEFYLSEEKAKVRQTEIYEGMVKLAGFMPKIEAIIIPIEVIE